MKSRGKVNGGKQIRSVFFSVSLASFLLMDIWKPMTFFLVLIVMAVSCLLCNKNDIATIHFKLKKSVASLMICGGILAVRSKYFYTELSSSQLAQDYLSALRLNNVIGRLLIIIIFSGLSIYALFCILYKAVELESSWSSSMIDKCQNLRGGVQKRLWIAALLLISLTYTLVYAARSPLVSGAPEYDCSIFYLVAKGWIQGKIPYVDMFDHKGPLIFLIYVIGQLIPFGVGMYVLDALALWISLYFAFKISQETSDEKGSGWFCVLLMLVFLSQVGFGDTLTEDFCLPLLMASMYLLNKYLCNLNSKTEHPWLYAAVYGVTCAVAFLTRATNAITIIIFIAGISIILLCKKQFICLLKNAVGFMTGFFICCLPFCAYFAFIGTDALYEMIWGTLLYNMEYMQSSTSGISLHNIVSVLCIAWPVVVYIIAIVIGGKGKKNTPVVITSLISALVSMYVVGSGNLYLHYFIILAVYVPIMLNMVITLLKKNQLRLDFKIVSSVALLLILIPWLSQGYDLIFDKEDDTGETYEDASLQIASLIPEKDLDQVIGYNTSSTFYLYTDIMPCFKYFTIQDWQSSVSERMLSENLEFYSLCSAKWVIVQDEIEIKEISDAINENYVLIEQINYEEDSEIGTLELYKAIY